MTKQATSSAVWWKNSAAPRSWTRPHEVQTSAPESGSVTTGPARHDQHVVESAVARETGGGSGGGEARFGPGRRPEAENETLRGFRFDDLARGMKRRWVSVRRPEAAVEETAALGFGPTAGGAPSTRSVVVVGGNINPILDLDVRLRRRALFAATLNWGS
jgi:hypothetical protein